jgi:hypothetical protein
MPKYDVTVVPFDGNAFSIMGAVTKAMKQCGATEDELKAYRNDAMLSDYDHLLRVSGDMVWLDAAPIDDEDEDYCDECGEEWEYCDC